MSKREFIVVLQSTSEVLNGRPNDDLVDLDIRRVPLDVASRRDLDKVTTHRILAVRSA